uniref:Uncharacterized protein n=1 Tax=Lepeophtheirus salmonis TaxID=72036 RepID=A0A0K2UR30_LEPSM
MNNWTKAFKYSFFFTFVILIICSFIFQNKVYINIMEGNIFYNEPLITAWKSKFNNLSQNVIPNIRRQKTVNSKRVTKIMGMNPFVQYAFERFESSSPKCLLH